MTNPDPDTLRERALAAERQGHTVEALRLMAVATSAAPGRAELHNTAGNIALRAGQVEDAISSFSHAHQAAPHHLEFAINFAIALGRGRKPVEALAVLDGCEAEGGKVARYCSVRAALERDCARLAEAERWYAQCLTLEPTHMKAQHGLARVALERGDDAAVALFDKALASSPADRELWLGKAQALDAAGRPNEAREIGEALVAQIPGWVDALRLMSQLRVGAGEADFTADYRVAVQAVPDNPAILTDWCSTLSGLGYEAEAADVAARGCARFGAASGFALLEAVHAGAAGDDDLAEIIFAALSEQGPARWLHEARHRIRRNELDVADDLLARVIESDAGNVTAWALRDVAWRLAGDPRHAWLHGQEGLVAFLPLEAEVQQRKAVTALLEHLHDGSSLPLGQSVRGGSQTRGGLFNRMEPELHALKAAILCTLESYRKGLPAVDANHPLLKTRDIPWRLAGSWSVRLSAGGGAHVSHIHPQGIISSAAYLVVPPDIADADSQGGWLEVGRPAADLRTTLPPLHTIRPREGFLALFPSTLYHGTRSFMQGRRMTVAFDVAAALS